MSRVQILFFSLDRINRVHYTLRLFREFFLPLGTESLVLS